jgi:multiple sugar transport system permease protein
MGGSLRLVAARVGFSVFVALAGAFFALPILWLVFAPFDPTPTLAARPAGPTLANFRDVFQNPLVLTSLRNSVLLALYAMVLVVAAATLAAYALSRVRLPGRDLLLYVLLLFSSVVSGTAAMVPLFLLVFVGLNQHLPGRHPGADRRAAAGGHLHPQGLHRHHPDQLRGVGPGVRGLPVPDPARHRRPPGPAGHGRDRRLVDRQRLGELPDPVHPAARPRPGPGVGGHLQLLHRGRPGRPAPAVGVLAAVLGAGGVMYLFVQRRYGFRFYGGIKR